MTDAEAGRTRDFLGYGRRPPDPRWLNGAHVAVNFVIIYEEGGEYSVPDGDPASEAALTEGTTAAVAGRNLAAESMFMYGSRAGFWRLHRMFTKRNIPYTVFAVARALDTKQTRFRWRPPRAL
jgi:allantoinase